MKIKNLDVDIIGGQVNPITIVEQIKISTFINQEKEKKGIKLKRKTAILKHTIFNICLL